MELKDFIKGSLVEICEGIGEARAITAGESNKSPIAPSLTGALPKTSHIDFDIAVSVSQNEQMSASGKVGIKVVASAEGGGAVENKRENNHRIQFTVPYYPQACMGNRGDKK